MDQASACYNDLFHMHQVLSGLDEGLAHHGVGILHGSGVAGHRRLHRQGGQGVIQRLQLRIPFGQLVGVVPQHCQQLLRALDGKSGEAADLIDAGGLHDAPDAVAHANVALHGPLGEGLRQALIDGVHLLGHPVGHGVDVRGRAAHIHGHQIADAGLALAAAAQQLHGLEHRRGGRHQDVRQQAGHPGEPLGLDDAVQENLPDLALGGLDIQHAEFRHDVGTDVRGVAGEDALAFPGRRPVARNDDGEVRRQGGQHLRIVEDALLIAAVGSAHQEEDVGLRGADVL